ncbi:MAG: uracil-DNA glycosylase [Polyangiaceae bacterium]
MSSLTRLHREIVACAACPRLVAWRDRVAHQKVARFREADYWGKPVPGFGDPNARILVVGLAPGAHGANRTGRMFTGDRSGDFLFAALHRAGLANQPTSVDRADGLALLDTYIVAAIRCAPPGNAPLPGEIACCSTFFDAEIALVPRVRVVIALGAIAWRTYLDHLERRGIGVPRPRPPFVHGAQLELAVAMTKPAPLLLASYHVSQQNTQTGRLTPAMFDAVLATATQRAKIARKGPGRAPR